MYDYESMSPIIPSGDATDALPPQYFYVCAFRIQSIEKMNKLVYFPINIIFTVSSMNGYVWTFHPF